ncbi:MAG TPA: winged helix DNA-binding domain-containing protein [Ornithinicoccus sp.]|nr:winged helix DNA-binding domain-containing protein [Ornithinicoccus sp.]
MRRDRVLRQRLATQRLASAPLRRASDVVRLLTCVQSQERDHAFWSMALRSRVATLAEVHAEHDRGEFLRTHMLRPTWHLVAPEDLRWILALTSPRVEMGMGARHRQLGLDDPAVLGRALDALGDLLLDGNYLTRAEIGRALAEHGVAISAGERLGHLLLVAELRGLICSGPVKGVHHSYALVDEVVPAAPTLDEDEALQTLARRFFAGHGPASVKDFTRWSSLRISDTRNALDAIGADLERVEVDGEPHWFDPSVPRRTTAERAAYLLPVYDEVVLTYPRVVFPAPVDHPHAASADPFWAPVVVDRTDVGLWKRTLSDGRVLVETRLAASVDHDQRALVRIAAQQMADFYGRDLDYREGSGTPQLWGGPRRTVRRPSRPRGTPAGRRRAENAEPDRCHPAGTSQDS